ncbi:MAG: SusC/RagA family TonB-linked outer membrane protein [Bacteroidia bacterium]|nr:SusC/RagA family TonB-linked outer membrane protein [Bacteroidia bacterium]
MKCKAKMGFNRKLMLIIAFAFLYGMQINLSAQNQRVTLKLSSTPINEVFKDIKNQTNLSIIYNVDDINPDKLVNVNASNQPVGEVLNNLLEGLRQDLTYVVKDNYIVVTKKSSQQTATISQQKKIITGTVVDENNEPLIGVNVIAEGTATGTATDIDGKFSLSVDKDTKLMFSYIGYSPQTVSTVGVNNLKVVMKEDGELLDEVVVTALGIKRSEKALSYNVQQVKADELTTVKDVNFMNSLAGKVAGVNINTSAAGMGGATRVVMRGPKSINYSNQALYVIDGVPMFNINNGDTEGRFSAQPGGEGISDINPDDIASMSVLSGPAAAALYGSAAAQGVIMITTKKGQEGKVSVTISHNSSFSSPFIMPEFQSSYVNRPGEFSSWGAKEPSQYSQFEPKNFFNTGTNIQNTVSLTVGNAKNQTYMSIGTTNAQGIIPNSAYDRYNFTFRNTTGFLNDKMTLDFGFNYIKQNDKNLMAQGQYFNPLTSLYMFPRGENFDAVRTFELWDPARNIYTQNWTWGNTMSMQNPYWIANRMNRTTKRDRYMTNASLKYQVLDWLDLTGRIRYDYTNANNQDRRFASTYQLFTSGSPYGFYRTDDVNENSLYADLMANLNKVFGNITLGANVGISMAQEHSKLSGIQGGLKSPSNMFSPYAIDYGNANQDNHPNYGEWKHRTNSIFANVELGWKSMLYLTLTGRNDWDSALSHTKNPSFFYPSVGLSGVVSEMVQLPTWFTFLKVRGSWASVGSAIQRNITSPWRYSYDVRTQSYATVTYKMPENFYPERTNSWEVGLQSRFFKGALNFDATYYKSNTKNQTFLRAISASSGYDSEYVQTGNVENQGIELALGYNKTWNDFTWNTNFTYSMNRNKIVELLPEKTEIINKGGFDGANILLKNGGTMGDLYVYNKLALDPEGNIALNDKNNVIKTDLKSHPHYMGSVLPRANFGYRNDFTWKGFNFGFMLSARLGGVVISSTQAILDQHGVTKTTETARNNGGIAVNNGLIGAEAYYQVVGGESAVWSEYIYDGSNVRLQEAYLGYVLPSKWFNDKMNMSVSVTGRNLWMIYNKAPFDPELTASTGTYYQGFDYFMQPSLRNFGFNLKIQF